MRRRSLLLSAAAACLPAVQPARAQGETWPARPVRIVVTFPPGGSSDIVARILAEQLLPAAAAAGGGGQPPGRGGHAGRGLCRRRGAGRAYAAAVEHGAHRHLAADLPEPALRPGARLHHVLRIGATPFVLLANRALVPAADAQALVEWIRAQRSPPAYGSSGAGSVHHVLGSIFARSIGVPISHVPYRGSAPMLADLLGGSIPIGFDSLPQNVENIRGGRLRAFLVTSAERQALMPELPTAGEAGFPELAAENWLGLSGPAGLPAPVVARLAAEVAAVLALPAIRQRLEEVGVEPRLLGPEAFPGFVAEDVRVVGGAVKAMGLTAQ